MKTIDEFAIACHKVCGKFCYACRKYVPAENFTSLKSRKCKVCEVKYNAPKAKPVEGAPLSYMPAYKG